MNEAGGQPERHLSVLYIVFLSVGMVVGAGIFKSPALVADSVGSAGAIYGVWLLGGLISVIGALCYGELATAYPSSGGDYHFLTKAYGQKVGFAFAWARFSIINTGSIALLGFVIGDYLNRVWNLGDHGPVIYALGSVILLTLFNLRGQKAGIGVDYIITSLEVLGVLLLSAAAIWLVLKGVPHVPQSGEKPMTAQGLGYGLVFVLLAFGGWSEMATLSAEIKDPKRGMVKALVWSVIVITCLYLLANWALLRGLGAQALARSTAPAADLMARAFGPEAGLVLALAVAAAAITSINATIIVGARTTYAAANDVPAFAWLGVWNKDLGIPKNAIMAQGIVSIALVFLGGVYEGFTTLVDFTAPVYWLFLVGSGLAVIVLRAKFPKVDKPFSVPLYPVLPIIFALSSFAMLISSLLYVKIGALLGVGVLALGFVAMAFGSMRAPRPTP
jgi:basic amino acid/polyamine antiporter, APA family